jgi:hypothetical protein
MSQVAFTERAEQSLLDILGESTRLDETLVIVDIVDMNEDEVRLSFRSEQEIEQLQRDVDMVGPFRVPIAGHETTLFVRENSPAPNGVYELDYYACGGRACFQIRTTED